MTPRTIILTSGQDWSDADFICVNVPVEWDMKVKQQEWFALPREEKHKHRFSMANWLVTQGAQITFLEEYEI